MIHSRQERTMLPERVMTPDSPDMKESFSKILHNFLRQKALPDFTEVQNPSTQQSYQYSVPYEKYSEIRE